MRERNVHLVRHGETDWNKESRIQGRGKDIPLSDVGREQIRKLRDELGDVSITRIVTSPLSRALESADLIAEKIGVPVSVYEGLAERSLGDYEGRRAPEVQAEFPPDIVWHEQTPPNGESLDDFRSRIVGTFSSILADHPSEDLLVVCHGWVIRELKRHLTGMASATHDGYDIENATIYTFEVPTTESEIPGSISE